MFGWYAEENREIEEIFDRQLIQTEALNFIRGRSLEKTYLIIDEAQNMTPNQVKGIITRAGKGTKIILVGDPNQIDKPFLDERTNGLTYAAGKMKGSPLCYQLTMMATNVNGHRWPSMRFSAYRLISSDIDWKWRDSTSRVPPFFQSAISVGRRDICHDPLR